MKSIFVCLLRGINVGGNNIIPMADLRDCFAALGAKDVATYIQSGNVIFDGGTRGAKAWTTRIETGLSERFGYKARVVVRSLEELRSVVRDAPDGFGTEPEVHRSDVIFLKEPLSAAEAMPQVSVHPEVDTATEGKEVLYFSRLIALATRSRLNKLVGQPVYQQMTIRNWRTTTTLLTMMEALASRK